MYSQKLKPFSKKNKIGKLTFLVDLVGRVEDCDRSSRWLVVVRVDVDDGNLVD